MQKSFLLLIITSFGFVACGNGFERFAPPSNSISGRGAKVNPKILSTTPANGGSVSPVTSGSKTNLVIVFDMTMNTSTTPVINTYVRDDAGSAGWYSVSHANATFTWSSTTYANDTLTIDLGWVRWPENNVIGFDFDNSTLTNLDDMPLSNDTRYSFTVTWDTGRYKIVHTGQYECYYYSPSAIKWVAAGNCQASSTIGEPAIGDFNFPAGQNGFVDPMNPGWADGANPNFSHTTYTASTSGVDNGKRFHALGNPLNMVAANCNGNLSDSCNPYSVDASTTLVWKTCSEGQPYDDVVSDLCLNAGNDYTWGEAVDVCSALNIRNSGQGYAGRKDWRLPTIQELENLVDYGAHTTQGTTGLFDVPTISGFREGVGQPIPFGAFPNTSIAKGYWTATGVAALSSGSTIYGNAYVVEFKTGGMGAATGMLDGARATSNRKKVRCVAGPTVAAPTPSLTASTAGGGTALTSTTVPFTSYDTGSTFTLRKLVPDLKAVNQRVKLTITGMPVTLSPNFKSQGAVTSQYCLALATSAPAPAATCPGTLTIAKGSIPTSASDDTVTLITQTLTGSALYTLFVNDFVTSPAGSGALTQKTASFRAINAAAFDVIAANATSTTTLEVMFSRIPDATSAVVTGNYTIGTNSTCSAGTLAVSAATVSGYTVTLTTAAQAAATTYYVCVAGVTSAPNQIVTDSVNGRVWQRCRAGLLDNATCGDDGVADNEKYPWNDDLNYCTLLNSMNFGGYSSGWRAPTINEVKSIADRSLFGSTGYSMNTTVFPSPSLLQEDFASSTSVMKNGATSGTSIDEAWTLNYFTAFPAKFPKARAGQSTPPQERNIRCVRTLP
jgi:hypothetical protein